MKDLQTSKRHCWSVKMTVVAEAGSNGSQGRNLGGFSLLSTIRCHRLSNYYNASFASKDETTVLVPVYQKDGRFHQFENPVYVLLKILGYAQCMDCSPGGGFLHLRQSLTWLQWNEVASSRILFEPSVLNCCNYTLYKWNSCLTQLHPPECG